jgi:hypothetical protein
MTLDSSGKDLNRWFKGVIMTFKNYCRKAGWLAGHFEAASWRL